MATYSVHKIPLMWIPLSDGTKLAAKLWMPRPTGDGGGAEEKFPAILEFLPYRRADWSAIRDERYYPFFCCRGYVGVRVDMRGSGDSEGLYFDECEKQEQDDCCEVISWISQQAWCSGAVGMFGKSWGGFNSLLAAWNQPPALKAVLSAYSTDDRYSDDVHYQGGCVNGNGMLSWAHQMLLWNARPPHPCAGTADKTWLDVWLHRLRNLSPWVHTWLSHQTRDAHWQHGSICEDYSRIKCPVFLVGGWVDLYTNRVFRMMQHLDAPVKALVGPWGHQWPMNATPGPQIDFLSESLGWWDHHLKGLPNGIMEEPGLRVYLRDGIPDPNKHSVWPGSWIAEDSWPPSSVHGERFVLRFAKRLLERIEDESATAADDSERLPGGEGTCQVKTSLLCGAQSDLYLSYSVEAAAGDQAPDDGLSVCFETPPLDQELAVLGFPDLTLNISADFPGGSLVARLCEVFPDERSTLICRGLLNLTHRDGHSPSSLKPLEPNKTYRVRLQLDCAAYVIAAGHKLRLALSSNYWPTVWPSAFPTCITIHPGNDNMLSLPARAAGESILERDRKSRQFEPPPSEATALPVDWVRDAAAPTRTQEVDSRTGAYRLTIVQDYGCVLLKDTGTLYDEKITEVYTVTEDEPTSARVAIDGEVKLKRDSSAGQEVAAAAGASPVWDTRVQTHSEMWADGTKFYVQTSLRAFHQDVEVFANAWKESVERSFV